MLPLMLLLSSLQALAWPLLGPESQPTGRQVQADEILQEDSVSWGGLTVLTPAQDIGRMADNALTALDRWGEHPALGPGLTGELGVSSADVRRTLELVSRTAREDRESAHQRLEDPTWLAEHFQVLSWCHDAEGAAARHMELAPEQIRLTRYLVWSLEGRATPEGEFSSALYAVPGDEAALSDEQADAARDLLRHRYTRRQVLDGVYEEGGESAGMAEPLVWLRRADVHEALMQGTAEVRLPDGTTRTFNVHRTNGIPWDARKKDPETQDRFWYFREVSGPLGWTPGVGSKVPLVANAAVAGDVLNLGFGKLIALRGPDDGLRLVILADTGGAFQPNLYQLDFFTGTHPTREAFRRATASVPARVQAAILLAREP